MRNRLAKFNCPLFQRIILNDPWNKRNDSEEITWDLENNHWDSANYFSSGSINKEVILSDN